MPVKGKSNNEAGRPRGVPNKATASIREFITMLVKRKYSRIEQDLDLLDPYQRLMILEKLIGYAAPKMTSMDASLMIDRMSEEDLDRIFDKLIKAQK
jgi:uncharacterized protein YeeX (DUF496 family)